MTYTKRPLAAPKPVLACLSRYTHRVAIANSGLQKMDNEHVHFKYKDYRRKGNNMHKLMKVDTDELIRRFMLHILPTGFHRIRHYDLESSNTKLKQTRQLLNVAEPQQEAKAEDKKECTLHSLIKTCFYNDNFAVFKLLSILLFASTRES